MNKYRYYCMGKVTADGFGAFLEENLGAPRANITAFGDELGALFGATYVMPTSSGSTANLTAAMALAETLRAQGRPLEAVAAAYTFATTLSALMLAGFNVRLVDTEEKGFNLCPLALEKALTEKPASLVCITHLLGYPADMDRIVPLARQHGALILQDACETMDLRSKNGQPMGKLGDISTWSFYHPHHLSSYGGGAVVTENAELYAIADSISHWGRACTCHIDPKTCKAPPGFRHNFTYLRAGINAEMSELNACFGRFQCRDWEKIETLRLKHFDLLYNDVSAVEAFDFYPRPAYSGSPAVFPMSCRDGDMPGAVARLEKHGVECRNLMGGAMADQPAFAHLPHDGCKNARAMAARSFFIGFHHTLPTEDIQAVADIIFREFGAQKSLKASA